MRSLQLGLRHFTLAQKVTGEVFGTVRSASAVDKLGSCPVTQNHVYIQCVYMYIYIYTVYIYMRECVCECVWDIHTVICMCVLIIYIIIYIC